MTLGNVVMRADVWLGGVPTSLARQALDGGSYLPFVALHGIASFSQATEGCEALCATSDVEHVIGRVMFVFNKAVVAANELSVKDAVMVVSSFIKSIDAAFLASFQSVDFPATLQNVLVDTANEFSVLVSWGCLCSFLFVFVFVWFPPLVGLCIRSAADMASSHFSSMMRCFHQTLELLTRVVSSCLAGLTVETVAEDADAAVASSEPPSYVLPPHPHLGGTIRCATAHTCGACIITAWWYPFALATVLCDYMPSFLITPPTLCRPWCVLPSHHIQHVAIKVLHRR